jgi:hypothetical protein
MSNPFLLPSCGGLQDEVFQRVHDVAQGAGGAPDMGLHMETAAKLAERLGSPPRLRPNTNKVATTRRMSQARPASVSQNDSSG